MNNFVKHKKTELDSEVLDQAFQWAVSMKSGSVSEQQTEKFQQWLNDNPDNLVAWQQIQVVEQEFATLKKAKTNFEKSQKKKISFVLGSIFSIALIVSSVLTDIVTINYWRSDYMTGVAERQVVNLTGGAKIMLNSDSAITVNQVSSYYEIQLLEGEVFVDSSAASTPFKPRVVTADGEFTPTGTQFVIKNRENETTLQVIEGRVAMQTKRQLTHVTANQGWLLSEGTASPIDSIAIKPGGWTKLVIEANNARLGDVLDRLSHYRPGMLIFSDDIADLKVSGTFQLMDTNNALLALKGSLPIEVKHITKWVTQIKLKKN